MLDDELSVNSSLSSDTSLSDFDFNNPQNTFDGVLSPASRESGRSKNDTMKHLYKKIAKLRKKGNLSPPGSGKQSQIENSLSGSWNSLVTFYDL